MEIYWLHWGNVSIDSRTNCRRVLERVHRSLRETGTCWPWKTLREEWEGCVGYTISITLHDNPSTSTRHISSTRGRLSDWLRDNRLCAFHVRVQPAQGTQQETNISMCSFLEERYARLCTPLSLCSVSRHEGKCYATEVRVCADLINRIQVTAVDIVAERPFFRQGLNLTSLWGMFWGTGTTLRTALWLCAVQPVRYLTNKMYSKRSTLK
jgi:hypothetical protein